MTKTILGVFVALFTLSSIADTRNENKTIRVIELTARPANEIAPVIRPFLSDNETLQAHGNKLILQANLRRLDVLESLAMQMDMPPRNLRISIRQGTRKSGGHHGVHFEGESGNSLPNVNQYHSHDRDHINQQVLGLEGNPMFIESGQRLPFLHYYESNGYHQDSNVAISIDYQEVHSGFYAVANIVQESAEVLMSPYKENLSRNDGGAIDTSAMSTRVTVPLGVWTEIGGGFQRVTTTNKGSFYSTQDRKDSNHSIMMKVEVVE